MSARPGLERIGNLVVMMSALFMAIAVGYRTFHKAPSFDAPANAVVQVDEALWREAVALGTDIGGKRDAPITIVEFTDLECPACRGFQPLLEALLSEHSNVIRLLYIPHPLPYHRFAIPAANAAECADRYGRLHSWINAVYDGQDSLGLRSWSSYATAAGIPDTAALVNCARAVAPNPRISAGLKLGARIGVTGTPTVVINGRLFSNPPSQRQLLQVIDSAANVGSTTPIARIRMPGRIYDSATNAPLAGATVGLVDSAGKMTAKSVTDSGGDFEVVAPDGWYRISVTHLQYKAFLGRLSWLAGELPPHVVYLARTVKADST